MSQCSFSLVAAQLLVRRMSALQQTECCSATSAAQLSKNCSATSFFACGMLQGWGLEGWGLGLANTGAAARRSAGRRAGSFSFSGPKLPTKKSLTTSKEVQISFEPGFGAYQSLAQKMQVLFPRIFSFFLQFWRFEGDFKTRAKSRYAPNSSWNAF